MDRHGLDGKANGFFASRANIVLIGFLAIAGFFLVAEHRAHLVWALPYLPWLLLLACPLLHVFMHGGHGGHGHEDGSNGGGPGGRRPAQHQH